MFNDEQKTDFLKNLKGRIHHVYGSLNDHAMIPSADGRVAEISFPDKDDWAHSTHVEQSFENIRLISERTESEFEDVQAALKNRIQIIFLGFGFEETNIGSGALDLENAFLARQVNSQSGHPVFPVIKYTNLGDSEKIII